MSRVNNAFSGGMIEHGAVVEPFFLFRPGIGMGIEVHEAQGAEPLRMGFQQGIADVVVAAEREQR